MRRRSSSYSPPARRGREERGEHGARGRSRSPSRFRHGRRGDLPTSLLVRNIPRDCRRSEDLRVPFERYGVVKDVYLPKDYYTGEPRGFGFVQYMDPGDAAEAQYHMDHQVFNGREITVVFAEENRKKPQEMRSKERIRTGYGGSRRRSSPCYVRSRSRSPRHSSSPRRGRFSRSISPPRRAPDQSLSPCSPTKHGRSQKGSFSTSPPLRRGQDHSLTSECKSRTPPSCLKDAVEAPGGQADHEPRSPTGLLSRSRQTRRAS